MLKRLLLSLTSLVITMSVVFGLAQDVPQSINAALSDLSNREGRSVGLLDIEKWTYVQSNYPSPALGCPQPGVAYADVITSGFQFILTYNGSDYDYRVSNDQSIVILCGTSAAPLATPACPPADDTGFLLPRLSISVQGRVSAGGIPNLIRDQPGSSGNALGQIPPGEAFTVLDGPRCSLLDKIVWWQVNYNGVIGWTAEGKDGEYWLEPLDLVIPPDAELVFIDSDNAGSVRQLYAVAGGVNSVSPIGPLIATGDASGSIMIFNILTNTQQSITPAHSGAVTALAFGLDQRQPMFLLASGGADGVVRLWEVSREGALTQKAQLAGHTASITALAFNAQGRQLVSGSEDKSVRLWDVATGSPMTSLTGLPATVAAVEFDSLNAKVIVRDVNGGLAVFGVPGVATESAG